MSTVQGDQPRFDRWGAEMRPAEPAAGRPAGPAERARPGRVRLAWTSLAVYGAAAGALAALVLHLAGVGV